jgi:hypothetical protein
MASTSKVFVFCIGGTGARVLKALTFLLASGAKLNASKVIPIIIDPDNANGDVQRTIEALKNYQAVRRRLEFTQNGFFGTEIQTLASVEGEGQQETALKITDSFKFDIDGTKDGIFQNFIGYDTMSNENKAMTNLLFADKNLSMELEVGFKGNPHMGSIVLNQFKKSPEFQFFTSRLGQKDRVFIISSIFGGTGAAGFPLLVKNIRQGKEGEVSQHNRVMNVPIGAITVTPYFGIEPDENIAIDKDTFIAKTKAALEYYYDNLTGNQSLNALYYIGDNITRDYKAAEGKLEQKNNAHVIEMISALALFDFMNIPDDQAVCVDGKAQAPVYREYGIVGDTEHLSLQNLGDTSKRIALKSLTQYALTCNFLNNKLRDAIHKPENWVRSKTVPITGDFLVSDFYNQQLSRFNARFKEWLDEMKNNTRSLHAFNLDTTLLHNIVNGYTPMKKGLIMGEKPDEWTYEDYNYALNAVDVKIPALPVEQRFLAMFYQATAQLWQEKFKTLQV